MLHFRYCTVIDAPIEVVWAFHERADILLILTPPWQPVQILYHQGGLNVGAISAFRLLLGFLPIEWIAQHIECNKPYLFIDRQISGPMQYWLHRHQFIRENQKTQLIDAIEYEIPGGFLSEFLIGWWVDSRLKEMFRYRHQITQQYCKNES